MQATGTVANPANDSTDARNGNGGLEPNVHWEQTGKQMSSLMPKDMQATGTVAKPANNSTNLQGTEIVANPANDSVG